MRDLAGSLRRRAPRSLGLRLAALCAAAAAPLAAPARDLTFDTTFGAQGEPVSLHYQATFLAGGAPHRLEVWRDGERRLKRRTDDAVEIYAQHAPGDPEVQLSVLDLRRRIHTRVDRTNLYRLGSFTDWYDLAHGLRRPAGSYRLARGAAPKGAPRPLAACSWYALTQGQHTTHVCWSERDRVPMLLVRDDGAVLWQTTALDRRPIPPATFEIHDAGFVRNDASEDIAGD